MYMGWNWLHTLLKSLGQIIPHGIQKHRTFTHVVAVLSSFDLVVSEN